MITNYFPLGSWSVWTGYGACSSTCQVGLSSPSKSRTRYCVGATFGGNCNGLSSTETIDCNAEVSCPGIKSYDLFCA